MTDQELWLHFKEGEKDAFEIVFNKYHDELYRFGLKLSNNNEELVKDSIQDLFLKLWKVRNKLKAIDCIHPYLLRSLRNQIIDNKKIHNLRLIVDEDIQNIGGFVYSESDFYNNEKITDELKARAIMALNTLKPKQKEIVYLKFFEELNYKTISIAMEMNVQSVRNLMNHVIKILREIMMYSQFLILFQKF